MPAANLNLYHWLAQYMKENPIPRVSAGCVLPEAHLMTAPLIKGGHLWTQSLFGVQDGAWDDVSGETFLRKLLSMPIEAAKWKTVRVPPCASGSCAQLSPASCSAALGTWPAATVCLC